VAEGALPPLPQPDAQTRGFWEGCRAHELRLLRCRECRTWVHQPAAMCHACGAQALDWAAVSGRGSVYTWTVVHHAPLPAFQERTPYVVAWIELVEQSGLRILSNVVGCAPEQLRAGLPVRVTFRDLSDDIALPLFEPDPG
jgi:uncharacterized OB-fold protein